MEKMSILAHVLKWNCLKRESSEFWNVTHIFSLLLNFSELSMAVRFEWLVALNLTQVRDICIQMKYVDCFFCMRQ